ncbi:21369_t:CDS:1, partial [Gigaspora margarita]
VHFVSKISKDIGLIKIVQITNTFSKLNSNDCQEFANKNLLKEIFWLGY